MNTNAPAKHPLSVFALYLLVCILMGGAVAYPLSLLMPEIPFDRVLSRSVLLVALILLIPVMRFVGLTWSSVGFRHLSLEDFLRWWLSGYLFILPPALIFLWLGYRVIDVRVVMNSDGVLVGALSGLASGFAVGLFEETVFRGVLLSLWRRAAPRLAVLGCSLFYAAVHFLDAPESSVATPGWGRAYHDLFLAFGPLMDPGAHWDSFLALTILGVGLCVVRERTGNLWACVALHGAFVSFLKTYKDLTIRDIHIPEAWLVGSYDHFVGLLTSVWILMLVALYLSVSQRTARGC